MIIFYIVFNNEKKNNFTKCNIFKFALFLDND